MANELVCPHTEMTMKMHNDLYYGDARKPGLTVRMQQQEDGLHETRTELRSVDRKFWAIILLLLTTLGGVATDLAVRR